MHSMSADRSALEGRTITADTRRRVWGFARPYRAAVAAFMATVVASTFLGLLPPLVVREIFDSAIATGDGGYLNLLFSVLVAAAAGEALLSLVERRLSSGIGEGLILDLRLRLFDHVQRMPLAFFTRTQTGTLVSRLNNDVIGAQRAFTGTLGTVVANVITLVGTLIAMFVLEWRLTLLAVVILPVFVLPARWVGRRLQAVTREGMNLNASMNNTMTERFNVAGALLVKLFGRYHDEAADFADRAGRVRDIGVRSAMYSRVFLVALTLVGAVGTAVVYWLGGHLAIDGALTAGTLVALGLYTVRIYAPLTSLSNARVDVMSAFVSFERVFEVLDTPNPVTDSPDASDLTDPQGRVEFRGVHFAYPAADGTPESLGFDTARARDGSAPAASFGSSGEAAVSDRPGVVTGSVGSASFGSSGEAAVSDRPGVVTGSVGSASFGSSGEAAVSDRPGVVTGSVGSASFGSSGEAAVSDRPGVVTGSVGSASFGSSGEAAVSDRTAEPAEVLVDIDLDIAPGQTVAVVGPSGSGKTTMVSLVPRLHDVTAGAVLVDGVDVRRLTQASLRAAIGTVTQDPHLFHDTVAANLRYACPAAADSRLVEACRAARIHDVIAALPDGYDTVVGERGYRLSGGEKQRLAIARMLLKDPAIVILDEATSHLDTESEALVQEALTGALRDRTSLVVAHRLSTIVDADMIVVVDGGRITETGTHDELRLAGGLYAELYEGLLRAETAERPGAERIGSGG